MDVDVGNEQSTSNPPRKASVQVPERIAGMVGFPLRIANEVTASIG